MPDNTTDPLYAPLLDLVTRLFGTPVMDVRDWAYTCTHPPAGHRHHVLLLPDAILTRREDGEREPVRAAFCAESAATAWLAGAATYWIAQYGWEGTPPNPDLLAAARAIGAETAPHRRENFHTGIGHAHLHRLHILGLRGNPTRPATE